MIETPKGWYRTKLIVEVEVVHQFDDDDVARTMVATNLQQAARVIQINYIAKVDE